MRRILLPALLTTLLATSVACAGVVNGSFEAAPPGTPIPFPAPIPGWHTSGKVAWRVAEAAGFAAPNGDRVVELPAHRTARLWQSIDTVTGEGYELLFWLGSRPDRREPGSARVRVEIGDRRHTAAIENNVGETLWQPQVITFTATGPATTLAFRSGGGRVPAWIDAVVVRPAPSTPVASALPR